MGLVWRGLIVASVFALCGLIVARLVIAHGLGRAPLPQVQLAGAMAGLFAGGAAATVTLLLVAFTKRR